MLSKEDIIQQQALSIIFLISHVRQALEHCENGTMSSVGVNRLREAIYGEHANQLMTVIDLETGKPIDTGHVLYADVYEMLLECLTHISHYDDGPSKALHDGMIKALQRGEETPKKTESKLTDELRVETSDGVTTLKKLDKFKIGSLVQLRTDISATAEHPERGKFFKIESFEYDVVNDVDYVHAVPQFWCEDDGALRKFNIEHLVSVDPALFSTEELYQRFGGENG